MMREDIIRREGRLLDERMAKDMDRVFRNEMQIASAEAKVSEDTQLSPKKAHSRSKQTYGKNALVASQYTRTEVFPLRIFGRKEFRKTCSVHVKAWKSTGHSPDESEQGKPWEYPGK